LINDPAVVEAGHGFVDYERFTTFWLTETPVRSTIRQTLNNS